MKREGQRCCLSDRRPKRDETTDCWTSESQGKATDSMMITNSFLQRNNDEAPFVSFDSKAHLKLTSWLEFFCEEDSSQNLFDGARSVCWVSSSEHRMFIAWWTEPRSLRTSSKNKTWIRTCGTCGTNFYLKVLLTPLGVFARSSEDRVSKDEMKTMPRNTWPGSLLWWQRQATTLYKSHWLYCMISSWKMQLCSECWRQLSGLRVYIYIVNMKPRALFSMINVNRVCKRKETSRFS